MKYLVPSAHSKSSLVVGFHFFLVTFLVFQSLFFIRFLVFFIQISPLGTDQTSNLCDLHAWVFFPDSRPHISSKEEVCRGGSFGSIRVFLLPLCLLLLSWSFIFRIALIIILLCLGHRGFWWSRVAGLIQVMTES